MGGTTAKTERSGDSNATPCSGRLTAQQMKASTSACDVRHSRYWTGWPTRPFMPLVCLTRDGGMPTCPEAIARSSSSENNGSVYSSGCPGTLTFLDAASIALAR